MSVGFRIFRHSGSDVNCTPANETLPTHHVERASTYGTIHGTLNIISLLYKLTGWNMPRLFLFFTSFTLVAFCVASCSFLFLCFSLYLPQLPVSAFDDESSGNTSAEKLKGHHGALCSTAPSGQKFETQSQVRSNIVYQVDSVMLTSASKLSLHTFNH